MVFCAGVFANTDGHIYLLARQSHTYPDNQSHDILATKRFAKLLTEDMGGTHVLSVDTDHHPNLLTFQSSSST